MNSILFESNVDSALQASNYNPFKVDNMMHMYIQSSNKKKRVPSDKGNIKISQPYFKNMQSKPLANNEDLANLQVSSIPKEETRQIDLKVSSSCAH